ncbi:hypothetical protein [Arthrobacter sp. TMS1-12-1]
MTAHHRFPLTSPALRTVTGTVAVLLAGAVLAPVAAFAVESGPSGGRPAVVARQQPGVVEQPGPDATFGEPAPPVVDPLATSGTDPATGFAINARTGFLVHPATGHLIEPGTGNLVFADTLIYTNLRYDAATGEVAGIAGEAPVPAPSPSPSPAGTRAATASPSASTTATPSATGSAPAPVTSAPPPPIPSAAAVDSAPAAATASATPRATRSATPAPSRTAEAVAEEERTASLAPVAWIGAALVAAALAVVAVLAVRRRRH